MTATGFRNRIGGHAVVLDMLKRILGPALLVALVSTTGCDDAAAEKGDADPATTSVSVAFTDSSVPPEHHRSWELTLDQDTVHLVVDSYGVVIADETVDMPAAEWETFVSDLDDGLAAIEEPESGDPCPGGTSISLAVDDAGSSTTSVPAYNCGGNNAKTFEDIVVLVEPFSDLVDLKAHTAT